MLLCKYNIREERRDYNRYLFVSFTFFIAV